MESEALLDAEMDSESSGASSSSGPAASAKIESIEHANRECDSCHSDAFAARGSTVSIRTPVLRIEFESKPPIRRESAVVKVPNALLIRKGSPKTDVVQVLVAAKVAIDILRVNLVAGGIRRVGGRVRNAVVGRAEYPSVRGAGVHDEAIRCKRCADADVCNVNLRSGSLVNTTVRH
jgi:hypothetical protein